MGCKWCIKNVAKPWQNGRIENVFKLIEPCFKRNINSDICISEPKLELRPKSHFRSLVVAFPLWFKLQWQVLDTCACWIPFHEIISRINETIQIKGMKLKRVIMTRSAELKNANAEYQKAMYEFMTLPNPRDF